MVDKIVERRTSASDSVIYASAVASALLVSPVGTAHQVAAGVRASTIQSPRVLHSIERASTAQRDNEIPASLLDNVWGQIAVSSPAVQRQGEALAQMLEQALSGIARPPGSLPAFAASHGSDGSLMIEWIIAKRRLGFGIEVISADSNWFFVSGSTGKFRSASGLLSDVMKPTRLSQLLRDALLDRVG